MNDKEEQYQNLLEQIHELNRQNFLNDNEKLEELFIKIDKLENKINRNQNQDDLKKNYIVLVFLVLNIFLSLYIILNNQKEMPIKEKLQIVKKEDGNSNKIDYVTTFEKENIDKVSSNDYEEIKPIIRKGTQYFCDNESISYKIPYTVEIKGKLYSDKFVFILQENDVKKECFIKKDNI